MEDGDGVVGRRLLDDSCSLKEREKDGLREKVKEIFLLG